jgi:hypothetical protein
VLSTGHHTRIASLVRVDSTRTAGGSLGRHRGVGRHSLVNRRRLLSKVERFSASVVRKERIAAPSFPTPEHMYRRVYSRGASWLIASPALREGSRAGEMGGGGVTWIMNTYVHYSHAAQTHTTLAPDTAHARYRSRAILSGGGNCRSSVRGTP